jgi:hypothetical protein
MPRKPSGRPTGRPKKPVDPSVNSNAKSDAPASLQSTDAAPAHAPGSPEMIATIQAAILKSPVVRLDLAKIMDYHTGEELKNLRAELKTAKDEVGTLTEKITSLTTAAAQQQKTITQQRDEIDRLETANAGLQAFHDAAHSEEVRIIGDKAETARLAELARVKREKADARAVVIAAFIIERDEHTAEYERRVKMSYAGLTTEENIKQYEDNNAYFKDYHENWEGRTEPPEPEPEPELEPSGSQTEPVPYVHVPHVRRPGF